MVATYKTLKSAALICAASVVVSSCDWPSYGGGGMDEVFHYSRLEFTRQNEMILTREHEYLAAKVDKMRSEMETIQSNGGNQFYPGEMVRLEELWNRCARELAGGFLRDAATNLGNLENGLEQLKQTLRQRKNKKGLLI